MPSAGDNLSLGGLGKAVGANGNTTSETALASDGRGSTGTETSLSDFYISSVNSTISGVDTTPDESTTDGVTIGFSGAGSLFNTRIRSRTANFTWVEVTNGSAFNIIGTRDYRATISYGSVTSNTSAAFKVTFADSFNDHATRYNTGINRSVSIQETDGGGFGGDPGGESCFIEGTQVLMADGAYKNIEYIEIGESVKGNSGNNTVLDLDPTLLENRLLYGFNGETPFVTAEHPFMTTEGWKSINPQATIDENVEGFETLSDIGQLQVDDIILGSNNVTINSIVSASAATSSFLWNFNVDGDNTYYADGYIVHNKCFVGDTLITMADSTYKPIEDIEVNDLVFTQNGNEKVNEVVSPIHNNIVELSFSNGNTTKNTDDHPYYVIDKGWCSIKPKLSTGLYNVKCEQLEVSDIFIDDEDVQIELLNIEKVNGEFKTYTFSTDSKTYYANKLLVHSEI